MASRPDDYKNDLEFIQAEIGKRFTVYKTEVEYDIVNVYVRIMQGDDFEEKFDDLRKYLVPLNYIPFLREEKGEYIISVKKQPEKKFRSTKVNLIMLIVTLGTTLIAGMWWWASYDPGEPMLSMYNLTNGAIFFTIPLMAILGIHEMGHYFMARHHDIKASLPFFLPFAPPLGTIGAFISIREPIPDRKSLLDVGVAGPICGFIVAVPVSILGLYLGGVMDKPLPVGFEGVAWVINYPLIFMALDFILPFSTGTTMHPTAFAGWVGFLVTGLNLLPAGQLDGGHIVRSLLGDHAKYTSYVAAGFLVIVGILFYPGWLIFAIFLLFFVGLKHPPPLNELGKLDLKRKGVGIMAMVLLLTCFHPIPIGEETFSYDFSIEADEAPHQIVALNESVVYTLTIENTGKPNADIYNISYRIQNHSWSGQIFLQRHENNETYWESIEGNHTRIELEPGENHSFRLEISPLHGAAEKTDVVLLVESDATGRERVKKLTAELDYSFEMDIIGDRAKLVDEGEASFVIDISNRGRDDTYLVSLKGLSNESWSVYFVHGHRSGGNMTLDVPSGRRANFTTVITSDITQQMEFYIGTRDIATRSGVVLIIATIEITSMGSHRSETIDVFGVIP